MLTSNPLSLTALATALRHRVLSRPILADTDGAATVATTAAIEFTIDGITYNKAALAAQVVTTMATGARPAYVQPAGTTVYYVLCLNSAGAVHVVQGTYSGQDMGTGRVDKGTGGLPDIPDGYCPFGIIKVATVGVTFTLGTTNWNAAGVTSTPYDISSYPGTAP